MPSLEVQSKSVGCTFFLCCGKGVQQRKFKNSISFFLQIEFLNHVSALNPSRRHTSMGTSSYFFCLKNQQWNGYYRRLLLIWLMYEFQKIKKTCLSRLIHPWYTNITDLSIKLLVSFFMSFCSQIRGIHLNFFGTIFRGPLSYLHAKLFYPEKEQKKIFPVMNLLIKMLREGGYFLLQGTCPCK